MGSIKELLAKVKRESRVFNLDGVDLEVCRLNNNQYNELHRRYGANFLSGNPEDYRMRPDLLRAMVAMAAKPFYPDVTDTDIGEILTARALQSPEFIGMLLYIQGQPDNIVNEQMEQARIALQQRQGEMAAAVAAANDKRSVQDSNTGMSAHANTMQESSVGREP